MNHPENDPKFLGLKVNQGTEEKPTVNPYLDFRKNKKKIYSVEEYVDGILDGNITLLSQAVTLVESTNTDHYKKGQEIIEKCISHSGNSVRIGITGVPGAGKSTTIDSFGLHLLKEGHKVAVLAIDPSSERSKGSILGDKTRMERLSTEKDAFIRPSPSAGSLGGVARKTRETIILCEAAGFDRIIIETVGVGQSETAVHSMVDFFLLLQLSGSGDELQGIKRGIMEMADGIAINKADGDNIKKAELAKTQISNALHLFPTPDSGFYPKVITYSGYFEINIDKVNEMIEDYVKFTKENGYFSYRRNYQNKYWMYQTINEQLKSNFYNNDIVINNLPTIEEDVLHSKISSFTGAKEILDKYFNSKSQI